MHYSSLRNIINEKEINIEAAAPFILKNLLWRTLQRDHPQGIAYLAEMAKQVKCSGKRLVKMENPDTPVGKQIIDLLASDIVREICEQRFDVAFGLYHACSPVAAPTRDQLELTPLEQIKIQNKNCIHPVFAV